MSRKAFARLSVLAVTGMCLAAPAQAENPTLTDDSPRIEWSSHAYVFPNMSPQAGGPPVCLDYTVTCHEYFFSIQQSPEKLDVENDYVLIAVSWGSPEADFDPYLYDADTGEMLVNGAGSSNPDVMFVPVRNGSFNGNYRVVVAPFLPIGEHYDGLVEYRQADAETKATVSLGKTPFDVFNPEKPYATYSADEPTMGINRKDNKVYMIYNSSYLETAFDDSTSPATPAWNDVTGNGRPQVQLDPFMSDDEHPLPDGSWNSRIWGVGFGLAVSDMLFSDEPSTGVWTRTNTAAAGLPAGVDNESIASGPYPDNEVGAVLMEKSLASGGKGHAFYYCAHAAVNAFCVRSDDGGLTYNTGRAIFSTSLSCNNHGHVKVGSDGTVYVPMNNGCQGGQGVSVSLDAGETWTYLRVPGLEAAGSGRWDSNIAIANDGKTFYYAYAQVAIDEPLVIKGTLKKVPDLTKPAGVRPEIEWGEPVNVGRADGLKNMVFSTMVAGDPDRAALAFHGSQAEGDSGDPNFKGTWYLYVATTYDGGNNWQLNNVNPSDPTQKGGVCDRGINCPSSPPYRNLLDFMDAVIDRDGRVVVGHADGCVRNCVTPEGKPTYSDVGGLARQAGGLPMFAAKDELFVGKNGAGMAPKAPVVTATPAYNTVRLSWKAPWDGGKPVLGYRVFRSAGGASPDLLATLSGAHVNAKPYFIDRGVQAGVPYAYQVQAFNAVGDGAASPVALASVQQASDMTSGTVEDDDTPTVRNHPKAEEGESACVPPGLTVVEDGANDGLNGAPLDVSQDIRWIAVAEPGALDNRIVFTLKVEGLPEPDLPQHRWVVYFKLNNDPTEWYVAMSNTDGALRYEYGKHSVMPAPGTTGVGQFEYVGDLEPESGHTSEGHITLVLDKADVGGLKRGDVVDFIYAKVRATSPNPGTNNAGVTRDDTGQGFYQVVGNESCKNKALTVAAFDAYDADGNRLTGETGFSGSAPATFTFDASPTRVDSGVSVVTYHWDFGDGRTLDTASPRVEHTYQEAEVYRVKLAVTDSLGRRSNHAKLTTLIGLEAVDGGLANEGSYSIFGGSLGLSLLLALAGLGALRRRIR